jgi:hypothetical protein
VEILNKIQRELKAPKDKSAKQYKYRSCESILEAVKPLLGDAILTMTDGIEQIGERVYVKATVTLKTDKHSISASAYAREPLSSKFMSEPQLTGAASSYARKYALCGLFCIDDSRDVDADPTNERPEPTKIEIDVMDSIFSKLLDSVPEGRTLIPDRIPSMLWALGGKYPDDIAKAGTVAAWLISQGAMDSLTEAVK